MVALDRVAVLLVAAGGGARLDDVRVERALDQDAGQLAVLLLDLGLRETRGVNVGRKRGKDKGLERAEPGREVRADESA